MDSPSEDSKLLSGKKGQSSSGRRTRSQTLAVRKEPDARPKKTLNFLSKKSRVYGKNHVKKTKKRKRLRNSNLAVAVYPKRRKVYDEAKERSSSEEDLESGDFYIRPKKRYNPRIGSQTNVDIVNLLKEKLDARQIQMFRETCFGHFLDLPHVVVQHQLIHHLLLREVVQEEEDALWISFKDVRLHFGLVEFGTITGLKCTGDTDKCYDSDGTGRLLDTYFSELTRVPKQSLIECFLNKRWKSDEDAVKIAVLYFIHTFLFSTVNRKHISRDDFELVDSGAYETYPWGKAVFKATLESIKGKLRGKPSMYRLGGLPLAFQCWFYECCPYVNNKIAFRVDDKVPRILSWKVTKQPNYKELSDGIFRKRRDDQLNLRNISPTEFERTTLGLPESVEIQKINEVSSGDGAEVYLSDEDLSSALPLASWKPKTRPDPSLSNVDWRTEFKRLSDGQSELKSEIQLLNKEFASLKDGMRASFANIFKAIESVSKKQGEKTAYEFDGVNDPHDRHGDSDSSEFSSSEDDGGERQEHGEEANEGAIGDVEKANEGAMGDKDNNEKANEGTMADVENENEVAMGDIEKANEGAMPDEDNDEKANEGTIGDVEKANEGAMADVEKANEGAMCDEDNTEKVNEGTMGSVEKANEGAMGDVEKANEGDMGDVEKAKEGAMDDTENNEKANKGTTGDVEKANEGDMGDVGKANEGAMGDKENNEKANEGTTGDVDGRETLGDPAEEGERMDVSESQIHLDTGEASDHIIPEQLTKPNHPAPVLESPHVNEGDDPGVEGSSKKSSNAVDYSLLTEFDKWVVDKGMNKQTQ